MLLNSQHPALQKACIYILQIYYQSNKSKEDPDINEIQDDDLLENIELILPKNLIVYLGFLINY